MENTIELVIKIPKGCKQAFDNASKNDMAFSFYDVDSVIGKAIVEGTVLPKGHGDLIDREWLLQKFTMGQSAFYSAPTIIEKDGEV